MPNLQLDRHLTVICQLWWPGLNTLIKLPKITNQAWPRFDQFRCVNQQTPSSPFPYSSFVPRPPVPCLTPDPLVSITGDSSKFDFEASLGSHTIPVLNSFFGYFVTVKYCLHLYFPMRSFSLLHVSTSMPCKSLEPGNNALAQCGHPGTGDTIRTI